MKEKLDKRSWSLYSFVYEGYTMPYEYECKPMHRIWSEQASQEYMERWYHFLKNIRNGEYREHLHYMTLSTLRFYEKHTKKILPIFVKPASRELLLDRWDGPHVFLYRNAELDNELMTFTIQIYRVKNQDDCFQIEVSVWVERSLAYYFIAKIPGDGDQRNPDPNDYGYTILGYGGTANIMGQQDLLERLVNFCQLAQCMIASVYLLDIEQVEVVPGTNRKTSTGTVKNRLRMPISTIDLSFTREYRHEGPIEVSPHLRLQPYGPGRAKYKIIFIDGYTKQGYHRKAKAEQYRE